MSAVVDSTGQSRPAAAESDAGGSLPIARARRAFEQEGPSAYQVTQPILFKGQSTLATLILSLRAASPAVVASVTLFAVAQAYGIQFTEFFTTLSVVVTVLAILMLQSPRNSASELLAPRRSIAFALLFRWTALLCTLAAISYVSGFSGRYLSLYPPKVIATWAFLTPVLLIALTLAIHELARWVICQPQNTRAAVFVGFNDTSASLATRFAQHPELCLKVAGFFDDRGLERIDAPARITLLGPLSQLPAFVRQHKVEVIFIALPLKHIRRVQDLLDALGDTTVSLYYLPDVPVSDLFEIRTGEILGVPVIALRESPFHGVRGALKRAMDIVLSSIALLATSPLLLAIAIAIKCSSQGPIIFRQRRYGLDGREITIYKFRTMSVAEDSGWLVQARREDARINKLGRFLRRWSLDEFPQLVNVLQGRMSLVGPRPHAVAHNEEYRRLVRGYMVRHKVPPGITGLAQVKGFRGQTPRLQDMQARVHYDLQYVHHWTLWLDVKILLMTIPKLLITKKAY